MLTGVHELDRTSVFTRRARHNGYCLQGVLNGGCVGTRVGARHLHPRVPDRAFKYLKAGVTPEEVLVSARRDMEPVLAKTRFAKETHRQAAEDMLSFRGHLP